MKCYRTCQGHAQALLGGMLSVHFLVQAHPRHEMLQNLQIGLIEAPVNGMSKTSQQASQQASKLASKPASQAACP